MNFETTLAINKLGVNKELTINVRHINFTDDTQWEELYIWLKKLRTTLNAVTCTEPDGLSLFDNNTLKRLCDTDKID